MAKKNISKKRKPYRRKKKKGVSVKRRLVYLILILAGILLLLTAMLAGATYAGLFGKLPDVQELRNIRQDNASLVYDAEGSLMGKYYLVNRQSINNEAISAHVRHALIATEDSRFFEHHGIDMISLGRVFFKSLLLGESGQGGGSTISQQLAKNLFPRRDLGFISLPVNKVREMFIASRLEDIYSKEQILTMYLNTVAFGENVFGIEAAAYRFFGKPSSELNISESATLVGMLAGNTLYNPRMNPERSQERRNTVFARMQTEGFISKDEQERLSREPIRLNYRLMDISRGVAPYFRHFIRQEIRELIADSIIPETDGLRIYTTINPRIQEYAEKAIDKQMAKLQSEFDQHWKGRHPWEDFPDVFEDALRNSVTYQKLSGQGLAHEVIVKEMAVKHKRNILTAQGEKLTEISALDSLRHYLALLNTGFLAVDPRNGAILAWIRGTDFQYLPYDHVTAQRQAGSTFKPFVYATALAGGMKPCTYIANDLRTYEDFDNWSPQNANGQYGGYYNLAGGLANSVNTITAEVIMQTGPRKVAFLAHDMGITAELHHLPSLALGTASVSLLDMVTAYTGFANYGQSVRPWGISKITDRDGHVLYEAPETEFLPEAFPEGTGMILNEMLMDVVNYGTARSARSVYGITAALAGKTGTTQNNADGWFIGYTPGIVAGAWVGAESPAVHFRTTALGSGAHMALPVVASTLSEIQSSANLSQAYLTPFRPLPDSIVAMMDCPPYSEEIPRDYISREEIRELRREARENKEIDRKDSIPGEKQEKEGFFKKIRNFFRGKRGK